MHSSSTVTGHGSASASIHNCATLDVKYHLVYAGLGVCFEYDLQLLSETVALSSKLDSKRNAPCAPSEIKIPPGTQPMKPRPDRLNHPSPTKLILF